MEILERGGEREELISLFHLYFAVVPLCGGRGGEQAFGMEADGRRAGRRRRPNFAAQGTLGSICHYCSIAFLCLPFGLL